MAIFKMRSARFDGRSVAAKSNEFSICKIESHASKLRLRLISAKSYPLKMVRKNKILTAQIGFLTLECDKTAEEELLMFKALALQINLVNKYQFMKFYRLSVLQLK